MSLGGYIFRGYTCSKPSGISNTDWYLLIHKTRVKAFLEASNAADAGWVIDHTGGQIAFESTNGAIYRLDDLGYNYITTFKIPDEDAYFQILTLCKFTNGNADLASGLVSVKDVLDYYTGTGSSDYSTYFTRTTLFHRVGSYRQSPTLSSKKGMTPLYPVGSSFTNTKSGTYSVDADSSSYMFTGYTESRFGYAIKGKHIISVAMRNSSYYFSLLSADIYQTKFNTNDQFACYNAISFASRGANNSSSTSNYGETSINEYKARLYRTAYARANTWDDVTQAFIPLRTSNYTQATTVYPFSSVYTVMCEDSQSIQSNGIGSIPVDLLATNTTTGSTFNVGYVVANGNYICVSATSSSNYYVIALSFTSYSGWGGSVSYIGENIFLGWDPSNPDLNETSSWPIYREPVPYTYTSHNVGNTIYYTITLTGVSGNGTVHAEGYIIESNSSGQAQHKEINGNYNYTNGSFDLVGNWPFAVSSGCSLQISFV